MTASLTNWILFPCIPPVSDPHSTLPHLPSLKNIKLMMWKYENVDNENMKERVWKIGVKDPCWNENMVESAWKFDVKDPCWNSSSIIYPCWNENMKEVFGASLFAGSPLRNSITAGGTDPEYRFPRISKLTLSLSSLSSSQHTQTICVITVSWYQ